MMRTDITLQEALDRQASLRSRSHRAALPARPSPVRRLLGAWIVRLGRAVAGRPVSAARLA